MVRISTVVHHPLRSGAPTVTKGAMEGTQPVVLGTIKVMVVETMVTLTMTVTIKAMAVMTIIEAGMGDHLIVMEGEGNVNTVDMIPVNMTQDEDTGTVIVHQSRRLFSNIICWVFRNLCMMLSGV